MDSVRSITAMITTAVLLVVSTAKVQAQTPPPPQYPKESLSPWFEVEAAWPEPRPTGIGWEAVPGVAVDGRDRVWIYTRTSPAIQVYSARSGKYLFGWLDDPESLAHHLKIDNEGYVWLADIGLHIIRKHTQDGEMLMHLGTPGEPGDDESRLNKPTDMAFASNGDIFVSDGYGNNRIVHYDKHGRYIKEWGSLGTGPTQFSLPHAIAIDSNDRIYVADRNNVRVQVFNTDGELIDSWANILVPWGFWIDDSSGQDEIWVCGSSPMSWEMEHADYPGAPLGCPPKDQVFMKFSTAGKVLQLWTIPKGEDGHEQPGDLNWLHCMAFDSHGNLYAGDIIGKRIQKFVLQENE